MKKIHFTIIALAACEMMLIAFYALIHNGITYGGWFLSAILSSGLLWVILDLKGVGKKVATPTCLAIAFVLCLIPFVSITIYL